MRWASVSALPSLQVSHRVVFQFCCLNVREDGSGDGKGKGLELQLKRQMAEIGVIRERFWLGNSTHLEEPYELIIGLDVDIKK